MVKVLRNIELYWCQTSCSFVYRRRLCTQMLQLRDVFLGQRMCCSWGHVDRLVTRRKQRFESCGTSLKKYWVIFMSNYSPQAQKLLPILQKHQRLNWTADHVNATCGLNMKTRLRYGGPRRKTYPRHYGILKLVSYEVRTDTITSLLHCATQRSLWPHSLYFVRSLTAKTRIRWDCGRKHKTFNT